MFKEAVTFKDVLLVPQRSSITSRRHVDTSGRFSRRITLKVPIVSANMDTVTESDMAIAMARLGGLGVIHRFLTVEEEVAQVVRVKRAESYVIDEPYTLAPDDTVAAAADMMADRDVGGLLVVDSSGRLLGVVTQRDIRFLEKERIPVSKVMTSKLVTSRPGVGAAEAQELLRKHKVEKLPLVDKSGKLAGLITAKDLAKRQLYPDASHDAKGRLLVGAAVGVVGDYLERAGALHAAGADVLVVDVAHGHADHVIEAVEKIKKSLPSAEVVAGNVATFEGARDLVSAGADGIKVGVGPGAACWTRAVTGSGVPQLSAILDCARITKAKDVPICADGGIKDSGDITKALAAGASSIMIGSLLAGTDESPGWTIVRQGVKYKIFRGMASLGATLGRRIKEHRGMQSADISEVVAEGAEASVPYRGTVTEVVHQLAGGVRSGMSYSGARDLRTFWRKAKFIRLTGAGFDESKFNKIPNP